MRIEQVEHKIYTFAELPRDAQETVLDNFRQDWDRWGWASEWWDSAKAFSRIAPITIESADYGRADVEYSWQGVALRYDHDDCIRELSGLRAWKWLNNNGWFKWAEDNQRGACTMTGYCGDAPFGDGIMAYADCPAKTPTIEQVFYEAAQCWVSEARRDYEYAYSDEAIREDIDANEYEFFETGELV
ncbi:hypothetical protein [Pyruvatibacter mobilis]|uniref:hypothetical protein n=1 Tax=Pyruvatibacter mobilis TaxID=1712261 RepID=UPI003BACB2EE